ncbi:T9SS type A sorting domain-containing protein [Flavobacteriaceae bacterium 14752]|uniref:T9SS type A sorting domain-containing protein n=1 Tax=Mesohalobacter salilacus TaxID=2491711 RepID=UPI000F62DDA9|nr:T9SS C-terminal target domain-containing protein [Flavobacteriaceae bacterium 14752]
MKFATFFCLLFLTKLALAQNFTSYFTGNSTNIDTNPQFGVCLMGGASENDNAMQWFLNLADGGDVVVLRTSGADGYNDYMFNQLGVNLNSVETLRIDQAQGAVDAYVLQQIAEAEAIWFAGGDQADYVNYFKDTALEDLLNEHINIKQYPIGGISAGMAILSEFYFDALNGTITSNEALSNPFDPKLSLGISDFIDADILYKTITDTHYDNPDRQGRHMAFLARLQAQTGERVFGIGIDEFTAACIDQNGIAHIYGDFPNFNDYAYFIQVNCLNSTLPENLSPNQALDWNLNQSAVKTYKVAGTSNGTNTFDLNTWEMGNGGQWENWWVNQGNFQAQNSTAIDCDNLSAEVFENTSAHLYPNPVQEKLNIDTNQNIKRIEVYNIKGQSLKTKTLKTQKTQLNFQDFSKGIYLIKIELTDKSSEIFKVVKNKA